MIGLQKPFRGICLNRAHPLARNLRHCFIANEYTGGQTYDLVTGGALTLGSADGGGYATWAAGGINCDAHSSIYGGNSLFNHNGEQEITCVVGLNFRDNLNYGRLVNLYDYSTQTAFLFYVSYHTGQDRLASYLGSGDQDDYNNANAPIVTVGAHNVAVVWKSGVKQDYFVDGVKGGSRATPATATFSYGTTPRITLMSNYAGDAVRTLVGTLHYAYVFDRALTENEIALLNLNPYCMFLQEDVDIVAFEYVSGETPSAISIIPRITHHLNNMRAN